VSLARGQRSFSRGAFRWLESVTSRLRSTVRAGGSRIEPSPIAWSAFDRLQLVVAQEHRTTIGGEHRSRQRAASPDFADYRPYQHGDDARRIDWNVYGRLGVLQLRQTEAQLRVPVRILLDCSASMHWGEPDKLSFAREIALALSRISLARSDSVSITCLGHSDRSIGPVSGIKQFGTVERFVAGTTAVGKIDLTAHVQTALDPRGGRRTSPGLKVLISDLLSVTDPASLFSALRGAGGSAVALHIVSRAEAEPEAIGDVDLVDAETGAIVEVGLSMDTIRQYRERYDAWRSQLERHSSQHGVRYVPCSTERTVQEVVLADLRARQVVR
jgi:uncharacterized protein (DUF58 family)